MIEVLYPRHQPLQLVQLSHHHGVEDDDEGNARQKRKTAMTDERKKDKALEGHLWWRRVSWRKLTVRPAAAMSVPGKGVKAARAGDVGSVKNLRSVV
mmetsp:Transcript_13209/g.19470  ORF Transcript_13209/g.19470 Transcript_13209/m.19470 type:complete len:97 (-) Transcript_13209:73-363(-)